jgi:hypothetical protein
VTVIYRPEARALAERAKQVACASARPGGKLDTARAELDKGNAKALHTARLPRDISDGLTVCQLEANPEEDLASVLFRRP